MKITVKNNQLNGWVKFLSFANLKGQASLGRTKLKEKLQKLLEQYGKDEVEIIKEYAYWTDEDQGLFEWHDKEEGPEVLKELKEKEHEINLFDYAKWSGELKKKILEYDQELDGEKADAWAQMYEQFDNEDNGKDEK